MSSVPRPYVSAGFPKSSPYADFVLRIERPRDEHGHEVLNAGWDILYERKDGSVGYNHWADDWNEVLLYFSREQEEAPPWVAVGKFKDAIFPDC